MTGRSCYCELASIVEMKLANYVNSKHQLFLDVIDMGNEGKINKGELRKRYLQIKSDQSFINKANF